jgi:hypothetical protein
MEDSGVAPLQDHPSSTSTLCFHCAFGFRTPNHIHLFRSNSTG